MSTLLPKLLHFCNFLQFSLDKIEERDRNLPMLPRLHVETWGITQPMGGVVNEVPSSHDAWRWHKSQRLHEEQCTDVGAFDKRTAGTCQYR